MPIRIVQVNRERTLSGLARRAYQIEGPGSAERTRRAEAALLAANPHLGDGTELRAGMRFLVPDVAGLELGEEARAAAGEAQGLLGTIDRSIAELAKGALAALSEAEAQAVATTRDLGTAATRKIVERNAPALVSDVPKVQEAAAKRAAELKDRRTALSAALDRAKEDLVQLAKQLG